MSGISLYPRTAKSALTLAACLALCLIIGVLGSMLTVPSLYPWFASLEKPSFNPPNWIFSPVWTTLFVLMGYALWRILSGGSYSQRLMAFRIFTIQLVLNLAWSGAFFYLQCPGLGLIVILFLLVAIAITMALFFKLDRVAGWLFVPYVLWVSFATVLNLSIFLLN